MSTLPSQSTADASGQAYVGLVQPVDLGPQRKRWTREEYYRLEEQGFFLNQRVELIDGEILVVSPQSHEHYWSVDQIRSMLEPLFGPDYWVRSQGPAVRDEFSEPEPDVCVVSGSRDSYSDHPRKACLMVEVSKTSLHMDTTTKAHLYASMGVPDYWVLDLEHRQLHVFRKPIADAEAPFGSRYQSVETIAADGVISPLEKPDGRVAIANILPPVKSK